MVSPSPAPRERSVAKGKPAAGRAAPPPASKRTPARPKKPLDDAALRILHGAASEQTVARAAALGFNRLLCRLADGTPSLETSALRTLGKLAGTPGVGVLLDIELHRVGADWPLVQSQPTWFQRVVAGGWPVDPRRDLHARELLPRFANAKAADGLAAGLAEQLAKAIDHGAAGFAINGLSMATPMNTRNAAIPVSSAALPPLLPNNPIPRAAKPAIVSTEPQM